MRSWKLGSILIEFYTVHIVIDQMEINKVLFVRLLGYIFSHNNGRSLQAVDLNYLTGFPVYLTKLKNPGRAGLHACAAAHALRIVHRQTFIGKVHNIYSLMADRCANVTGNAFLFVRYDSETAKSCVYVHQCRQWTHEPAPYSSAIPKIQSVSYNSRQDNIHHPFVIKLYPKRFPVIEQSSIYAF